MTRPERARYDLDAILDSRQEQLFMLESPSHGYAGTSRVAGRGIPKGLVSALAKVCLGGPWPMVVTGPAGTGKTCAALCVADRVRPLKVPEAKRIADYGLRQPGLLKLASLASHLMDVRNGRDVGVEHAQVITPKAVWDDWEKSPLAIADEVNSPPTHDNLRGWHMEVLLKCLDSRQGRPTLVISNHALHDIARLYDDRIASRLSAGTVYAFGDEATDQRTAQGTLAFG